MKSPRILKRTLVVALLAATIAPAMAVAQTDLTDAISANAELLMEATALVRETNSAKARAALDAARKLHEGSITLQARGNNVLAARAAREAREAILRAIAIARQEVKLEENAHKAIERARQRHEQARLALDDSGARDDNAPRKLVEEARVQLERSQDNLQQHMFEIALRLANASSDLSTRALQMLRRDGSDTDRLQRELNRTDNILARLDDRDAPARGGRLLDEARELQEQARRSARSGKPRVALEQTQRARQLALRVLKSAESGDNVDVESLSRALRFTDEVIERAREGVRKSGKDDALQQLREATRTQETATTHMAQGQLESAMRLTLRAREMAKEAVGGADRPLDRNAVQTTLRDTDETLRRLGEALTGNEDAEARSLFERATRRQTDAWGSFEAGHSRKALALTKVARNLANTALRRMEKGDG